MLHDCEMRMVPRDRKQLAGGTSVRLRESVELFGSFGNGVAMHFERGINALPFGLAL